MNLELLLPGDLVIAARRGSPTSETWAYVWPCSTQDLRGSLKPPTVMEMNDLGIVLTVRQIHTRWFDSTIEACVMTSRGDIGYIMAYDLRKVDL